MTTIKKVDIFFISERHLQYAVREK